jgi:phage terminase large subunit
MITTPRRVIIPYNPRSVFKPYHSRKQRWACLVAHRRCGKTVACINDLIKRAIVSKRKDGRYAYVGPLLSQAKEIAWDYLKRYSQPITTNVNESELFVELINGARIRVYGADNPDRLRGIYLDGIVLDEFAQMRPSVFGEVIRPTLADREGWGTFIGTPKGHNQFYEIMYGGPESPSGINGAVTNPDWFTATLRLSETDLLSATEVVDMRRTMTEEQYEQEAECSFEAAIQGAYFGKEMAQAERDGRVREVPYEAAVPVYTAWDLGKGSNLAIWFWQVVGTEIRVIDYWEGRQDDFIPQAAEALNAKPYVYECDFVPHDAKVPELGTGRTRVETLTELRRRPRVVADHKVMDGINAVKLTLPRVWFDREKCRQGIEALKQYHAAFDEKARVFKNEPKHDWTSHAADAFRYLCMAWRELAPPEVRPVDVIAEMLRPKTLDEMLKEHFDAEEDAA